MTKDYSMTALWLDKWLIETFKISTDSVIYFKLPIQVIGLLLIAYLAWILTTKIVVASVHRLFLKTKSTWDDLLIERKVFDKLASVVPFGIIALSVPYIFYDFPEIIKYTVIFSDAAIIAVVIWSINATLTVIEDVLGESQIFKDKPITSYVQVLKIIVYFIGAILILSILLGKSPLYFLGAMGAMTAVLLLVFKDTILGLVASIQMSVYDMVRVGDWISMPKYEADGDVISINLNTVKVQNWDKTITTIPTYAFITDSFKNWRGMSDSGGRRIKRSVNFKMSSFKFLQKEDIQQLKHYRLIKAYLEKKEIEIHQHNETVHNDENGAIRNIRRLSNIGVFRHYIEQYIQSNENIKKDMTIMVRQLEPTSKGLPLEIYCFSAVQDWLPYENIIADIFDHVITIASEFHLEVFEEPSGSDFQKFMN
jgi:miniconductance mechanosensitive channel